MFPEAAALAAAESQAPLEAAAADAPSSETDEETAAPCGASRNEASGVWVFVEQDQGAAHPVSWELLGVGRTLANDLGVELCALVTH
jgi:electron transfer flavoprotein alpha subunit